MNRKVLKKILAYAGIILLFAVIAYGFVPQVLSGKIVNQISCIKLFFIKRFAVCRHFQKLFCKIGKGIHCKIIFIFRKKRLNVLH